MASQNLWVYFADAGLVVKTVMLILLTASVVSWTFIIQRWTFLNKVRQACLTFESKFWSGKSMPQLLQEVQKDESHSLGIANIFQAGFTEFLRLRQQPGRPTPAIMEGVQRSMRIVRSKEIEQLETHLPFLASVGSISPYIGLFGTVWGIMTSFHALGSASQTTIAMVAPGISEALVATAMGLFAAIPAVLAYNRYAAQVDQLVQQYETFQDELTGILHRDATGASA